MVTINILPAELESWRAILEHQTILGKIYTERRAAYILQKNRDEKTRWKNNKIKSKFG